MVWKIPLNPLVNIKLGINNQNSRKRTKNEEPVERGGTFF